MDEGALLAAVKEDDGGLTRRREVFRRARRGSVDLIRILRSIISKVD